MDHTVGGGINKWHVRLLFHSEPHMKEEERQTERKKDETFSPTFVPNFNIDQVDVDAANNGVCA